MVALSGELLLRCIERVLRPAVRFCLRHALRIQDLIECAKGVMVEEAKHELERANEKVNVSRISAMTGLYRHDVERHLRKKSKVETQSKDLVSKVIGLWNTAPDWMTSKGRPKTLTADSNASEFARLVAEVSTDLNPGTVLFELERTGAVERCPAGVRLKARAFYPKGDAINGFNILGDDVEDLTRAVEANVLEAPKLPHFHARTVYDNVRPQGLDEIKRWFLREGYRFHAKVRELLSKHDQDINPDWRFKGKGQRVVFGAFSYVDKK